MTYKHIDKRACVDHVYLLLLNQQMMLLHMIIEMQINRNCRKNYTACSLSAFLAYVLKTKTTKTTKTATKSRSRRKQSDMPTTLWNEAIINTIKLVKD